MARVEFLPGVYEDLQRIADHLEQHEAGRIGERLDGSVSACDVLRSHPLSGSPARDGLRELVIGRGARGYIALYRYVAALDAVFVLAIRGQREAGYAGGD